jgi:hypothetical protein
MGPREAVIAAEEMILKSSNFEIIIQRRNHTELYAILGF